jgi:hypothetical protein
MDDAKVKEVAAKALQGLQKMKDNLTKMDQAIREADATAEAVDKALK